MEIHALIIPNFPSNSNGEIIGDHVQKHMLANVIDPQAPIAPTFPSGSNHELVGDYAKK